MHLHPVEGYTAGVRRTDSTQCAQSESNMTWRHEPPWSLCTDRRREPAGRLDMLMMALLWVGAIWLVVWGLRQFTPTANQGGEPDALETLKRRYARGEISYDEFEQARELLR